MLIALAACASARTASLDVEPLPCPAGGLPPEAAPAGFTAARPDSLFVPPLPVPASVRGAKSVVRVVVDAQGKPFADSITVCGVPDRGYARRMAARVARIPFRPAERDGRPVTAPTRLYYEF